MPPLALGGRLTQHNDAIMQLVTGAFPEAPGGGAMCDLSAWPEFHNGVAAGTPAAASRHFAVQCMNAERSGAAEHPEPL